MNEKEIKMYNIILEGCDGVGKSSIYEELMHRGLFGERMIGIQHKNKMPPKSYEEGKTLNEQLLQESNDNKGLVFDRHILSERVYGYIIRGYIDPIDSNYMDELEEALYPYNILFLITAELETVQKRFDGEGIPFKKLLDTLTQYKIEFEACYYPNKFIIDTTNITPYQALKEIERLIKEM